NKIIGVNSIVKQINFNIKRSNGILDDGWTVSFIVIVGNTISFYMEKQSMTKCVTVSDLMQINDIENILTVLDNVNFFAWSNFYLKNIVNEFNLLKQFYLKNI